MSRRKNASKQEATDSPPRQESKLRVALGYAVILVPGVVLAGQTYGTPGYPTFYLALALLLTYIRNSYRTVKKGKGIGPGRTVTVAMLALFVGLGASQADLTKHRAKSVTGYTSALGGSMSAGFTADATDAMQERLAKAVQVVTSPLEGVKDAAGKVASR